MCSRAVCDYKSGTCLASLRLCLSPLQECVALFKHKKPRVFHRDWLFANVCDRFWEVPEISVWGNRKKHCLGLIVRGCCLARDQLALCLQRAEQMKKTFFFYGRMILHRDMSAHINTSILSPLVLCHMVKTYIQDLNVHLSEWILESGLNNERRQGHNNGVSELTCKGQSFKWCNTWTLTLPQHNKMGCVPSISKGWNKS